VGFFFSDGSVTTIYNGRLEVRVNKDPLASAGRPGSKSQYLVEY